MALVNPTYRNIVKKMLQDPETLENIITASSGLENDPVAMELKLVFWVRDLKMTKLGDIPKLSSQHKTPHAYMTNRPVCEMECV